MSSLWLLLTLLLPTVVTPFPQDFLEKKLKMMLREQFPADTLEEYPDRENRQLFASDGGHKDLLAVLRDYVDQLQESYHDCPDTQLAGGNKWRRQGPAGCPSRLRRAVKVGFPYMSRLIYCRRQHRALQASPNHNSLRRQ